MIDLMIGLFIIISLGCGIRLLYESELMIDELKKERDKDE